MYGNTDSVKIKNPKTAFYFSTIPGLGQLYNGKIIKAILFVSLEYAAYDAWSRNKYIFNNYDSGDYKSKKKRYLEKRNKYAWWMAFIYVYGMLDAVVDAHLSNFNELMESSIENQSKEEN
tara:strand:+ start:113 stop:472 length:360 start_codon:yes stop_codon:yes gene_type:complete